MFMNFFDVISTLSFIGFGACVMGACLDYCDWLVIAVVAFYFILAVVTKILALRQYRSKMRHRD